MKTTHRTAAVLLLAAHVAVAHGRLLQQLSDEVAQPGGTDVLFKWHGVGTQNYTSASDSSYQPVGGVANLFRGNTTVIAGFHFFRAEGQATFTQIRDGEEVGSVTADAADPIASVPQVQQPDDGGFGSIPEALLSVIEASGTLANVNFIQRLNTKGGVVPDGLFTLPAFNETNNFLLAIPYQADYIFLVPEGLAPAPPAGGK